MNMELHHGLSPDYVEIDQDPDTSVAIHSLSERRQVERAEIHGTISRAEELFAGYPDGLQERELIQLVKSDLGVSQRTAAAAVDALHSQGKTVMDYQTGRITHPSDTQN